mmetsp:Transcript_4347/g.16374  ORF Transcript_4347/g.16374 Transcript_4347/m.16374 type:complete len:265 (+) Transcript_4347:2714-3508(+)
MSTRLRSGLTTLGMPIKMVSTGPLFIHPDSCKRAAMFSSKGSRSISKTPSSSLHMTVKGNLLEMIKIRAAWTSSSATAGEGAFGKSSKVDRLTRRASMSSWRSILLRIGSTWRLTLLSERLETVRLATGAWKRAESSQRCGLRSAERLRFREPPGGLSCRRRCSDFRRKPRSGTSCSCSEKPRPLRYSPRSLRGLCRLDVEGLSREAGIVCSALTLSGVLRRANSGKDLAAALTSSSSSPSSSSRSKTTRRRPSTPLLPPPPPL